jgi:phosphonopyruvate decarboxylase
MIKAADFLGPARQRGYNFWSGVPCSYLTPFINAVLGSRDLDYVPASVEGEAVAVAAGARMAGRKTVVICQNSGLGNAVSPLTSLNFPFRVPTIFVTTHRGDPGVPDEPQHELMGQVTGKLLETMGIPWEPFPADPLAVGPALDRAEKWMALKSLPYAFVMKKDTVADHPLKPRPRTRATPAPAVSGRFSAAPGRRMSREAALKLIREILGQDCALIATTGKTGRELFTLGHRPNQFYVVGSMGYASAIALGVHEGLRAKKSVAVIDGDGAALMHMGAFATIGARRPERFIHVVLDNEVHDSTGGQATVSATVDFAAVAGACGYRRLLRADTPAALAAALRKARDGKGPVLLHAKIAAGSMKNLGRPTVKPPQVKEEFSRWLTA